MRPGAAKGSIVATRLAAPRPHNPWTEVHGYHRSLAPRGTRMFRRCLPDFQVCVPFDSRQPRLMANTYTSLHCHVIFSTKNREPWIRQEIEQRVWSYLGGIARENG